MRHKLLILIGLAAGLVFAFSAYKIHETISKDLVRLEAERLVEAGSYGQAMEIYRGMEADEEARHLEDLYRHGIDLMTAGDLSSAQALFSALGDYEDGPQLLAACAWREDMDREDSQALLEDLKILEGLGPAPGLEAELDELRSWLLTEARELLYAAQFSPANELLEALDGYGDSSTLLWRSRRALAWASAPEGDRLLKAGNLYMAERLKEKVYMTEDAFIVLPQEMSGDTDFFIYFPGGRNEELSLDYLLYYMMDPSPTTMAVFLRRNGLDDMGAKALQAMDILEQAAAEQGLFVDQVAVAGSSLGAYPAMHSPIYFYESYRVPTTCVLSLDAGSDWLEAELLLTRAQCLKTAELGVDFYLFESMWVGMNREGIRLMVNTGNSVTMVGCYFDDHVQISLDAMGMGVVDWAVGDREQPLDQERYTFTRLVPDE